MQVKWGAALAATLVVGGAAVAGTAFAQGASGAAQALATRQQNFKQMGGAFKAVRDEAGKSSPKTAEIAANAQKLDALARQLPTWFPRGSGPESGRKTAAKPEVWSDAAGFAAAAQKMQAESAKLVQVANRGDVAAIKTQAQAVGGACKGCHDKYKVADER